MLNDVLRHLKKKKAKLALLIITILVTTYFFKDGELSALKLLVAIGVIILGFLILSWGADNPENNNR